MKAPLYIWVLKLFVVLFPLELLAVAPPAENKGEVLLPGEIYFPPSGYSGQQYLFEEWRKGDVVTTEGVLYENQSLKYNMLLDEVFWLSSNAFHHVMLDKGMIKSFTLETGEGKAVQFRKIRLPDPVSGNPIHRFVQVLYDGDISLYMLKNVRASSRSERVQRGGDVLHQVILRDYIRYYLEMPDGSLSSVSARQRSLLSNFPENRPEVRAMLRNENITIRGRADLVKAVSLLNRNLSEVLANDQ